jgi:GNAT superfamily N-acetyltransferase
VPLAVNNPIDSHWPRSPHAVEANLFAFFQHLKVWPRVAVHDAGDCIFTVSDLPYPLFNSVLRARVDDAVVDGLIEGRMQSCRERGVPMLWWTGPSTTPPRLGARLVDYGFVLEPAFGMFADLAAVSRPDGDAAAVAIERIRDRASLDAWSRVLCDGFGAPRAFGDAFAQMAEAIGLHGDSPFRHYLARADGRPVATCSLFLGAGVAGIYDVSTLVEHRRRGIGAAITRHAMEDARHAGCQVAILHASALGAGMYRSLGFETVCDIGQFVWAPDELAEGAR